MLLLAQTATVWALPQLPAKYDKPASWFTPGGDVLVAAPGRIAAINGTLKKHESQCDLRMHPIKIDRDALLRSIKEYTIDPGLYINGKTITQAQSAALQKDALSGIGTASEIKYGVIVRRSNLRSFPTLTRAFKTPEDKSFDMWQETSLDPGEPVLILCLNSTKNFAFVQLRDYRGWLPLNHIGITNRATWLHYVKPEEFYIVASPHALITDDKNNQWQCQMGMRLPVKNGKMQMPIRDGRGFLKIIPTDTYSSGTLHKNNLSYTKNNILRMAFANLGEPYDWGGMSGGVDCSALVQNIYRTVGIELPRNADSQAEAFPGKNVSKLSTEQKVAAIKNSPIGSVLYTPAHAMLYVGSKDDEVYILHALSSYGKLSGGTYEKTYISKVVLTPLKFITGSGSSIISQITHINTYR